MSNDNETPIVSGDALAMAGGKSLTVAEAVKAAHDVAERIKAEVSDAAERDALVYSMGQNSHNKAIAALVAENADLRATLANVREQRDALAESISVAERLVRHGASHLITKALGILQDSLTLAAAWARDDKEAK